MDKEYIKSCVSIKQVLELYGIEYINKNIKCPFHKDKTPSFNVDFNKQVFHCFGCGAGGDIFNFVMKMQNINFHNAVNFVIETFRLVDYSIDYKPKPIVGKSTNNSIKEYRTLCDYHKVLCKFKNNFKPTDIDNISKYYLEACTNINYVEYLLDEYLNKEIDFDVKEEINKLRRKFL